MSRKQAIEEGQLTYSGKPCKNCNTTVKYVTNWGCVECSSNRKQSAGTAKKYAQSDKGKIVRKKINQSDQHQSRMKEYNNGEKGAAAQDRFFINNPEKPLEYRIKKYGITVDQYYSMKDSQNNCCAICNDSFNNVADHIDHCHNSGKVRALLCHHCNTGLGLLKENTYIMKKMIDYVENIC